MKFGRSFLFVFVLFISIYAFAGGSIFGGHKTRTSNPNGVSSIGIHICGSLNCPGVILKNGDCGTVEHATTKYGVCVCDDGYKADGGRCVTETSGVDCTDEACCHDADGDWVCSDAGPSSCICAPDEKSWDCEDSMYDSTTDKKSKGKAGDKVCTLYDPGRYFYVTCTGSAGNYAWEPDFGSCYSDNTCTTSLGGCI